MHVPEREGGGGGKQHRMVAFRTGLDNSAWTGRGKRRRAAPRREATPPGIGGLGHSRTLGAKELSGDPIQAQNPSLPGRSRPIATAQHRDKYD